MLHRLSPVLSEELSEKTLNIVYCGCIVIWTLLCDNNSNESGWWATNNQNGFCEYAVGCGAADSNGPFPAS